MYGELFFVFAQVVGLGNLFHPETRYSVGMLVVDTLVKYLGIYGHFNRQSLGYVAVTKVGHQELILLKPSVAMNLNGRSISKVGTLAVRLFSNLWHNFCGILNIGTSVYRFTLIHDIASTSMRILCTVLHTFPKVLIRRIRLTTKGFFSW